jgi:Tol biopolymer transport system component
MKSIHKTLLTIATLFVGLAFVNAQGFGQNKVQYREFDWRFIQSTHFDIYFYSGGEELAEFAAEVIEEGYARMRSDFKWHIRKRGIIILYNSHNDFQQTNVVSSYLPEGVGGVTELFKNRVVVPFEGDYRQFKHVLVHELVHAVMNDMLYGGSVQSLISSGVRQVPIWFSEGLAEFESVGWDTRIDMLVRDVLVNASLEPIQVLNGLPYHFGTSFFKFIAQKYGRPKIGEILHKLRSSISFSNAIESAVGMELEDLLDEWYSSLKKEYWPDIEGRYEPGEIARQVTGTERSEKRAIFSNFVYGPTISPAGDKIAYILNKELFKGIYIQSLVTGKRKEIIEGESDSHFEELHILSPGLSFSPDGKFLAFSAKGGGADVLHLYDIQKDELNTLEFDLEATYGTSWSPDGDKIVFEGVKHGFADLFIYYLKTGEVRRITKDKFADFQPAWSFDSKSIVFVSDRGPHLSADSVGGPGYNMANFPELNHDIYRYDLESAQLTRITNTEHDELSPQFALDDTRMLYISDRNGIHNIFVREIDTGEEYALTNFYDGVQRISWSERSKQLLFASFSRMNRNAFIISNPFDRQPVALEPVKNINTRGLENVAPKELKKNEPVKVNNTRASSEDYSKFVFAKLKRRSVADTEPKKDLALIDTAIKDSTGKYLVNKYKINFTPDLVQGYFGMNTYFGLQNYTQLYFSDVLGDHRITLSTNLVIDLRSSDLILQYLYMPERIDYGFTAFHISDLYLQSYSAGLRGGVTSDLVRFRSYGGGVDAYYPLSKFSRLQTSVYYRHVNQERLSDEFPESNNVSAMILNTAYVQDNSRWWYFAGPVKGLRYNINFAASPTLNQYSKEFYTLRADFRKYFFLGRGYTLATRISGGSSIGASPQYFFLGGISNWLNYKLKRGTVLDADNVYFSEVVTPLRGADYYELSGTNYAITNIEFRFPFMLYLGVGFLPIQVGGIEGVMFADIGSAWNRHEDWNWTRRTEDGRQVFDDVFMGFGYGARMTIFGLLLRTDIAWKYDYDTFFEPRYYFSFGLDF